MIIAFLLHSFFFLSLFSLFSLSLPFCLWWMILLFNTFPHFTYAVVSWNWNKNKNTNTNTNKNNNKILFLGKFFKKIFPVIIKYFLYYHRERERASVCNKRTGSNKTWNFFIFNSKERKKETKDKKEGKTL